MTRKLRAVALLIALTAASAGTIAASSGGGTTGAASASETAARTSPTEGAEVDPSGFTVTWKPVTGPAGIEIVRYIVNATQGERELSMDLPPGATSASIPGQFLKPGTETGLEVLAREKSGNQTITSVEVTTK
jgi:hypothetical protein